MRDGGLEISAEEIVADGLIKKSPKDRLEVTIGTGMDLTVHGKKTSKRNKDVCFKQTFERHSCRGPKKRQKQHQQKQNYRKLDSRARYVHRTSRRRRNK